MSETEQLLDEILDFIHFEFGTKADLRIGIWSDTPTYYAVIYEGDNLITGEASYGSNSIYQALDELMKDIKGYKNV